MVADAIDYVLNELDHRDWVRVRQRFPWDELPHLALQIAAALMTPERDEDDWEWLLDMYQRHEHEEYTTFLLPNLFEHFHTSVVLRAIRDHQFASSDEAWNRLEALLYHEEEEVQIAAHRLLASFDAVEASLINTSLKLLPGVSNFREISWNVTRRLALASN